jgi:adenylate cyclase
MTDLTNMKNFKQIKSILLSPFTVGLLITLGVTWIAFDYYAHIDEEFSRDDHSLRGLIHQIHEKTIDWRMINRGLAYGSDRVAILAIDDESIRLEGRWPWPREKMAKLVDRTMLTYGAKLISFDMTFSEPDNTSSLPTLTRLNDQTSDASLKAMLADEIAKADADKIFANSIDASRDQLILGSFSSDDGRFHPYQDICVEAHFQRSYAGRYWNTEIVKPAVIDQQLTALQYPKQAVMANLTDYFGTIEGLAVSQFLANNPTVEERITKSLAAGGIAIDPGGYYNLIVDNLNNDYRAAHDHLEGTPYTNNDAIKSIFLHMDQAMNDKEIATLRSTLFSASLDYCHRFFTEEDELLHNEPLKKRYVDFGDALTDQIRDVNSWQSVWKNAQGSQQAETAEAAIERIKREMPPILIPEKVRWEVNIPAIDNAKSNTGYFDAVIDTDGTIRRNALLRRDGFSYVSSIAFKTYLVDQKLSAQAVVGNEDVDGGKRYGRVFKSLDVLNSDGDTVLRIPIDKKGFLQVNYSGPQMMFPHISASDLLNDERLMTVSQYGQDPKSGRWGILGKIVDKKEFLKDKILILGATAIGVYDLRVTPFEENFPGVETHANALSNLLVETARAKGEAVDANAPGFLRRSPLEESTMWIYLLAGGLILSGLLTYFGSVVGLGLTVVALGAIYAVDKYILFKHGIIVTTLFPVALVVADFVGLTSFKYFTEERKKRELKGTFEKYVSPAIVNEVLSDPENIELGGKKMELTVMFSDVRGFTTISEKLDPRALSDLLNSYLTPMTNLVFAHKGTLDKYMGDAIMAFWGAPVHFPDHAKHAARCALQMLVKLKELQAEYRAKGLPAIDIGIGLNTGEMSVGNMGSDTVRSYTVMGDAVNLGSRLEGINKQYGTRIIVSEFTQKALGNEFVCREVDWVKVKGKAQPVRIFELVAELGTELAGPKGGVSPETTSVLTLFEEGFRLYHEQKFREAIERFTNALSFDPNDAPSQLYVERCEDYLREPPPADWDGVFTMTSK